MDQLSRAQALYLEENFDEAAVVFSDYLKGHIDILGLSGRAACYLQLKRYTLALQDLNHAIQLGSLKYIDHYRKGVCLFELEEYEAANEAFEQALRLRREEAPDADVSQVERYLRKCRSEFEGKFYKSFSLLSKV